ncbi:ATP-binding protein [Beijerinckia indica]|uniref:AAA ATPase central domain protein n=1 Tax=Beijerinckia indica subsp. indica (strain ATCC 9039 / DSM 1715 / NCIMB 8712) TaxID=395963 RepID=B2IJ54_BEII9|nr:ATP-binding protein [Beijerinckia indica]ACB94817.1 AAA ATPase central domain protein [Beijerinckia indica subsp. indica ATCC 9039]
MNLHIERPHIELMIAEFPNLTPLKDQLRFGNRVEVPAHQLTLSELDFLRNIYEQAGPDYRTRAMHLLTLHKALSGGGERFKPEDLENVVPAIARYLATDGIRGWLFTSHVANRPLPYVVTRLDYTPPAEDSAGKIFLELKANVKGSVTTQVLRIAATDIGGKTVGEIFASKGFLKETAELIEDYDRTVEKYFDWRAQYGAQFSARGTGFYAEDPNSTHRDTDWTRKDVIVLSSSGGDARLVNDEGMLTSRTLTMDATGDILGQYLKKAAKSDKYNAEDEVEESQKEIPKGLFTQLPIHAYILMFHLELHHYIWVHVDDMNPYEYQPELKDKLVLPQEQTDLIDILTAEMDVLMDDIVAGKSGGTTVLCAGPAGVGKTLTAEVYSEIIRRPLYRVHSGQLGLNVAQMEQALKDVLTRAQRWGAVMLIDEADVYIKKRDDNIATNAVVGVFLRVLEYFNGLLFMTTNRVDDIDEAIVSRCIAMIKFHPPSAEARRRIWGVMTEQFNLPVEEKLKDELVHMFPSATGRDIKGLTKLTAKFCSHKSVLPTSDVFIRCSVFRGLDLAPEYSEPLAEAAE